MWLEVGNLWTTTLRFDQDEYEFLQEQLTFVDPRTHYVPAMAGMGPTRLLSKKRNGFPAGLTPIIVKKARDAGFTVSISDKRTKPVRDPNADLAWLRDYQLEAIDAVERRLRGILWLPTGSGKTEICVGVTRAFPGKWLFVAHKKGLMYNAAKRFNLRRDEHDHDAPDAGKIGDGFWEPSDFTAATFQTLAHRRNTPEFAALTKGLTGILIDECHTLPADSFYKTAMAIDVPLRVGVSGTPLARGDKRSIMAVATLGPTIHRLKTEVLVKAGVLARPKIRMLEVEQPDPEKATWLNTYKAAVVRSPQRNKALAQAAKYATKPCLLFVKQVAHGKEILKRLKSQGVTAEFTWGSKTQKSRERAIHRLVHGDTDVLVCSVIFQEGTDIPDLRSVVIGTGGKSVIAAIQRVGRGMRKVEGKDTFEVWDILDKGVPALERHANARKRAYLKEGYEVSVGASGQGILSLP